MAWYGQYVAKASESAQRPVYVAMIALDSIMVNTPVTATATVVAGDTLVTIDPGPFPYQMMVYNRDGWEMMISDTIITGGYVYSNITRGAYGTQVKAFEKGSQVISPLITFCTSTPDGTPPEMYTGMSFPDGSGQTLDMREGLLRSDNVTFDIQDHDDRLTKLLSGSTIVGRRVIILGGYEGMDFSNFVFLHVGRVASATITQTNVYRLEVDDITRKLKGRAFIDVEAAKDIKLAAAIGPAADPTLTDYSGIIAGGSTSTQEAKLGSLTVVLKAAMHYKVNDEIMRNFLSTPSSLGWVRAAYNTTASSHAQGDAVDQFFGLEGSPIGAIISFCLTRNPGEAILSLVHPDGGSYRWDYGGCVDAAKGAMGLGIELSDFDLARFEEIWGDWYRDYIGRFTFSKKADMATWIPKHILKPLNLCFFVNNVGQLSLAILRPPINADPVVFTTADIIGVPDIVMDNEELINDVTVQYDFDYITQESANQLSVIDATSQATYDKDGDVLLECRWLDTNWNAASLARRIAKGKMRHHRDPNPVITFQAMFDKIAVQPGDVVRIIHPDLVDIRGGKRGWDKLMWVSGKRVTWSDGTLEFDVIDTAYFGRRYGLIAPSGQVDYGSASDTDKASYVFLADETTNTIPDDGSVSYQVM